MHSLFGYVTSLEAEDENKAKGAGEGDKIADGGELQTDDKDKSPKGEDKPEGKDGDKEPPAADPKDNGDTPSPVDGAETPEATEDVEGTTTPDTSIDENNDEPEEVVFADIGNLQVDEVDKKIGEEQEQRDAQVMDAIAEAETLNATMEAMREQIKTHGHLTPAMGRLAQRTLAKSRARVNMKVRTYNVSQEDFVTGNKEKTSTLMLEGFKDTVRTIYNAVLDAIAKAIAWLKRVVNAFLYSVKSTRKNVERRSEAILKLRLDSGKAINTDPKKGDATATSGFNKARLMAVQSEKNYISLPSDFNALTIKGKQPGMTAESAMVEKLDEFGNSLGTEHIRYTECYDRITKQLKSSRDAFVDSFLKDDDFINQMQQISLNLMAGIQTGNMSWLFHPIKFSGVPKSYTFKGALSNGAMPPPGYIFTVTTPFIGNWGVVNTLPLTPQTGVKGALDNLGKWEMNILQDVAPMNDGWLRFLSAPEIRETSVKVLELCDELMEMEKSVDALERLQKRLERMGKMIIEKASDPMTADIMAQNQATAECTMEDIMGALNGVKRAMTGTNIAAANNAHRCATAWANYLQAHYVKDFKLVNGDASVLQKVDASFV